MKNNITTRKVNGLKRKRGISWSKRISALLLSAALAVNTVTPAVVLAEEYTTEAPSPDEETEKHTESLPVSEPVPVQEQQPQTEPQPEPVPQPAEHVQETQPAAPAQEESAS